MAKWIDFMAKRVWDNQSISESDKIEYIQMIFIGAMNDLIANVAKECIEKGFLIE